MTTGSDADSGEPERRYSMAFFVNINGDTMIDALTTEKSKYPTISAKEHLMAKHLASMGLQSNRDEL
jgi:isopenicillin N synthase-like dioxygenase